MRYVLGTDMNSPLSPEQLVNSLTVGAQTQPQVATLLDGSYAVVWRDANAQDGSSQGLVVQRFTAQGERIGIQQIVNDRKDNAQQDPSIAATEDGGFVIVWESVNQDVRASFDTGVFGQRFAANGSKAGPEFQVNTNSNQSQFDPEVVGVPGGGFAVTFVDDSGDGSFNDGIRLRIYDTAGVAAGPDVTVNTTTATNQSQPAIAAIQPSAGVNGLVNGGLVVTWTTPNDGSSSGVFAQVLRPDGTPVGSEFTVNTTTLGNQNTPAVYGLTGGRFVIVFQDDQGLDGSGSGIFARVFEGDGTPVGAQFQVNVETLSTQGDPAIVGTSDGGFVIAWTSFSNGGSTGDGSGDGVFARRFDVDGSATSGEIQLNERASSNQNDSDLTALANGDFVTVWTSVTSGGAGDGDSNGIFSRLFGEATTFVAPGASPEVEAFSTERSFDEATVNAGPVRLDADGAVAFADTDSTDFDGGRIVLGVVAVSDPEDEFAPQDSEGQTQLGLDASGPVSVAAGVVSVSGTAVGTISGGADGAQLVITLNASADAAAVEILLEHLTYANSSDDPRAQTTLELIVEDGDGSASDPVLIEVTITPEVDADGTIGTERQVNTVTVEAQDDSEIGSLTDGGYISVWTSRGQDSSGDGVFAQRYDANGAAVGPEFQVNTTTSNDQFNPSVAGPDRWRLGDRLGR